MKTKFYWVALLASAALIAQAQGGGHYGGGGGGGGGHFAAAGAGPARGGAVSSFHSMPMRNFGGGGMIYSSQRLSPVGMQSPSSAAFRQPYMNSNGRASIGTRQFTPANGNINRSDRLTRFSTGGNQAITNPSNERSGAIQNQSGENHLTRFGNNPRLAQGGNRFGRSNGAIGNHGTGVGQIRHGNNLPANWRNHVVEHHAADWHRDWDRHQDHWWRGHRCRFVNGEWFIFDVGFYPYDYWYPYGYPYDEYAYDYYPYGYDAGTYEGDTDYYNQGAYDSSDQNADSTVAAAQEQLARQGYYQGEIDGIFGPETRRAIMRYQSDHGLRVTGRLNMDTLQTLGLPRVASN
jgi:hypothetical protein